MPRFIASVGVVSILVVGFSACGSSTSSTSVSTTAASTVAAQFNAADATFAQLMIPHHQQAIAMAELALASKSGASAAVIDIATRIKSAQDPEIHLMQGWLTMWGAPMMGATAPISGTQTSMGSDMTSGTSDTAMSGMMTDADLAGLAAATGTEFDTMWLTMMISHHRGAVTMSMTEQQNGSNPDAKALAGKIITAQNVEVAEMNTLLGK